MDWGFYGRQTELGQLSKIFGSRRWFFAKITGRRRIGKTALVHEALKQTGRDKLFYVQIPDASHSGILSAVHDALETFQIDSATFGRPTSLIEFAKMVTRLARAGYIVVLDEFQYFNRERVKEFCSFLQAEVDLLSADAENVPGGLAVLGSLHTEMMAVLEDRNAPLYNRATDNVHLGHLDMSSLLELFRKHSEVEPYRFLFFWNLFEGVPKFYRDCYEQSALSQSRQDVLRVLFFQSSSPLKTEAENWFLKELHGRYDSVLKYIARKPGCSHADLVDHIRHVSSDSEEQVGGYLKILTEKYQIIERQIPILSARTSRSGKYFITDNFLRSWLNSLEQNVAAVTFSPLGRLLEKTDQRLQDAEGVTFEKLVACLYEERSRKGIGDFYVTKPVRRYWERSGGDIDFVAINEDEEKIQFGTCKRSEEKLLACINDLEMNVQNFLKSHPEYTKWTLTCVATAPVIGKDVRKGLVSRDVLVKDLSDLFKGL